MRFPRPVVPAAWAAEKLVYAEFRGERSVTAPLTWGQRAMWRAVTEFGDRNVFLNLRRVVVVSDRVRGDVSFVVMVLGGLLGRYESLRTRVCVVGGELRQVVADGGRLPVVVVEGDGVGGVAGDGAAGVVGDGVGEVVGDVDGSVGLAGVWSDRLGDVPFDHAGEWPLRVALVVVGGRVRRIVVVFSHSTVDFHGVEIVLRDLRLMLLRGVVGGVVGLQSVDLALREAGVERGRSGRAVGYWLREFGRLSGSMFEPVGVGLSPRFRRGLLVSEAVRLAAGLVAVRAGVSVSTVLLAATAALVTAHSGRDVCGLFTMSSNRFRPEYATAVAKLNQLGLCVLDLTDRPSFAELLPRAWRASLEGYRHAYYDPSEMERAFAEQGYDYGTALVPFCYLNDIRLPDGQPGAPEAAVDEAALRAAMSRTTFSWVESLDQFAWRCRVQMIDAPRALGVAITADTRYLPPDLVERYLRDFEAMLVEAACHDVPWPWLPSLRRAGRPAGLPAGAGAAGLAGPPADPAGPPAGLPESAGTAVRHAGTAGTPGGRPGI